jgi:hypothetical protein
MSELNFSVKHHRTLTEARASLEQTVRDAQAQFGAFIHKVEWSPDRNGVTLSGGVLLGGSGSIPRWRTPSLTYSCSEPFWERQC